MVSQKREELLSEKERERLKTRDSLDQRTRAANDSRAKRKLAAWLKNIIDVEYILDHLPDDQVRDIIDDNNIYSLLYTTERLMQIQKFHPIAGATENPDKWSVVLDENIILPAEDADIWRSKQLGILLNRLDRFIVTNENPVCRFLKLENLARMGLTDRIRDDEMTGLRKLKQVSENMISLARNEMLKSRHSIGQL